MNEISYIRVGDYLLPDIRLSDPPDVPPLGRYGMMHENYLRTEKPALYAVLLLTERLYPLYQEVDEAAAHRLSTHDNGVQCTTTENAENTEQTYTCPIFPLADSAHTLLIISLGTCKDGLSR